MVTAVKPRVSGIDSVRAFAALSVMLAHILSPVLSDLFTAINISGASYSKYIFTGHPAVIAFFVVSGFCIHYPYTSEKPHPLAFWAARWMRIMIPALIALLMAKIANMPKYNFIDGFILWSIVCELIYYTLYPAFYKLSHFVSWKKQFVLSLVISFGIVLTLGSDQYGSAHKYGPLLNWLVALPSWLIGCVLAEKIAAHKPPAKGTSIALKRLGVALTASILYYLTLNTFLGYYLTMNLFSVVIYFWLAAEIEHAKQGTTVFERVGKWSYSIYLYHMIFFSFLQLIITRNDAYSRIAELPLILLGCYVMYRLVEQPAHSLARNTFNRLLKRSLPVSFSNARISNELKK